MSTAEMQGRLTRLPEDLESLLVCPRCKGRLRVERTECHCMHPGCGASYPVRRQLPVLINEANSVFTIAGILKGEGQAPASKRGPMAQAAVEWLPSLSRNSVGQRNYETFARELLGFAPAPRILVIGSRVMGQGMQVLSRHPNFQIVESDVEIGPRPAAIFDAHDIPFEDGTFDGAVSQAVLEHVADPYRCVAELHRVLKPGGLIYVETPFMQQVHEGAFDFTRFTHLGHRRLLGNFDEIESGIVGGPGMALGWAWQYFLMSFTRSNRMRSLAKVAARLTAFPLKYFDDFLDSRPAADDAASGYYFLGRRSNQRISDRQLVTLYRGAQH